MKALAILSACCVALLALVVFCWSVRPKPHSWARITAAQTYLANFATALDAFASDNGFYPTGLQALVEKPTGTTNWHGPYLEGVPKDPWGREYIYTYPARRTNTGSAFDLRSLGPPGKNLPVIWSPDLIHPMREAVEAQRDGAANRSQPVSSETNRTSSAAGSGR
jgi:type II secretion system protein G